MFEYPVVSAYHKSMHIAPNSDTPTRAMKIFKMAQHAKLSCGVGRVLMDDLVISS
jgi:hypothetical protein